eukprot:TRINITY_DN77628_c0_g1_i1.p1 TRINITY_DN77628_c0_g1~~TRINITY_DN77628_c0_g1_i1.p1  ORF type:complete len:429 (-),score=54.32 TRINITY_DN77628_c0_g1_i1:28-1257(-)
MAVLWSSLLVRLRPATTTRTVRGVSGLVDRGEGMLFSRHLVDRRRLHVEGGHGGNGACVYTRHTKHTMHGPGFPCGGAGGRGGDVILKASGSHHSLAHVTGHVKAENGQPGKKRHLNGASGNNVTIVVPRGVVVRELVRNECSGSDSATRLPLIPGHVLAELDQPAETLVVAAGGNGGSGNNMARPHKASPGAPGEARHIELELKMVADVGLVGMPNAGKSTLLGAVSRACPKIAPYPFTTVAPYVGRVEFVDGSAITVADVPGLVEGAHRGEGLGHEFLRHLERTHILLYVVDCARSSDPFSDLLSLQREVALFSRDMAQKPCGVVANKCDLRPETTLAKVDELFQHVRSSSDSNPFGDNLPLFVRATSARFGEGMKGLLQEVRQLLQGRHERWLQQKLPQELREVAL